MEELRNIDEKYIELVEKRKEKNIKTCYLNIEEFYKLIEKLNQLDNPIINLKKNDLIEIYKKEIKMNINYIINLSYSYFMDNFNTENDYKSVLIDIQKSSFYMKYKSNYKIQAMELYVMIKELEISDDYTNFLKKIEEFSEDVFYLELQNEIRELIKLCKIKKINNEKKELEKLIKQKEFEKVNTKYKILIENYNEDIIPKNIKKEYNCFLDNLKKYEIEL